MNRLLFGPLWYPDDDGGGGAVSGAIDAVTDPVEDAVEVVGDAAQRAIAELAAAVRINTEASAGHGAALGRIEGQVAEIFNRLTETIEEVADATIETVEDTVEVVADAPVAATETIEAVIEEPSGIPERNKRGMIGKMKARKGGRRS